MKRAMSIPSPGMQKKRQMTSVSPRPNIRAVGSDLCFPGSSMGSPSVDVGEIAVAGK